VLLTFARASRTRSCDKLQTADDCAASIDAASGSWCTVAPRKTSKAPRKTQGAAGKAPLTHMQGVSKAARDSWRGAPGMC